MAFCQTSFTQVRNKSTCRKAKENQLAVRLSLMFPDAVALQAKWRPGSQQTHSKCFHVIMVCWNSKVHVVLLFTGTSMANTHLHEINKWMGEENGWALKLNSLAGPAGAFVPQLSRNPRLLFIMHSLQMLLVSIWLENIKILEMGVAKENYSALPSSIVWYIKKIETLLCPQDKRNWLRAVNRELFEFW